MTKKEQIEDRTWTLMQPYLAEEGLTGVDAEYVKEGGDYYLRIYIDKEGGVGIEDCERFSKWIDPRLDEEDFIPDAYTLEVSSPGLGRVLKRPRDFSYAEGREVDVHFYKSREGQKLVRGILRGADSKTVKVEIDGREEEFERGIISKINLAFDF